MRCISLSISLAAILFLSCKQTSPITYQMIRGETMGTTYSIKYQPGALPLRKVDIDSELSELNAALSTYEENSVITRFNKSQLGISSEDIKNDDLEKYFFDNVQIAKDIYELSDGFFEPTVMPLVNYWGFGYEDRVERLVVDSTAIDSILSLVGFDKLIFEKDSAFRLLKGTPNIELDFSAVAKGYAVDHLAEYLTQEKKIKHFFVDIGGENKTRGFNADGDLWRSGIGTPKEQAAPTSFDFIVQLKDQAIATSGNYRNFYQVNGEYISHTINPKTGYFERNELLSVSIIGNDCATADAWATACMAMGKDRAKALIDRIPDLFGVLIYQGPEGSPEYYHSPELDDVIERIK